ncbi:MAG: ABC transporter substrate-binding protein [Spirochaetaceae bacterium]|jgi:polar amino acid transport system substrate-binding protein|nr:ABC transporter substrate-binding protein [Spirochaetaceae bacterium]
MKLMLKTLFSFFILGVLCNGCTKQKQQSQGLSLVDGVLSVGIEVGYPPMEYYDADGKTLIGFDIELVKALADKMGLRANFIDTAWEGIMAGLNTDKYDIAMNITILPKRQERYNFTKPYIDSAITIVALQSSSLKIEKPEDIAGFRVAYQSDTTAHYFTQTLRDKGVPFSSFPYDKILNCFDDLKWGRIDLIAVDNIVAYDYTGKENSPFAVIWQGPSDELIGICLKKGNDALTDALNNALDALYENGTLLNISQQIFNRDLVTSIR